MATQTYDQGDMVRCSVTFADSNGTAADPTGLVFKVRNPAGTTTTYTYGVDVQLVKAAVGSYYVNVSVGTGSATAGVWVYRFEGSGTNAGAAEGRFVVAPSLVYA